RTSRRTLTALTRSLMAGSTPGTWSSAFGNRKHNPCSRAPCSSTFDTVSCRQYQNDRIAQGKEVRDDCPAKCKIAVFRRCDGLGERGRSGVGLQFGGRIGGWWQFCPGQSAWLDGWGFSRGSSGTGRGRTVPEDVAVAAELHDGAVREASGGQD